MKPIEIITEIFEVMMLTVNIFILILEYLFYLIKWILYKVYYVAMVMTYYSSYPIATSDHDLLEQYYYSWKASRELLNMLEKKDPKYRMTFLIEKYIRSSSKDDFIRRCRWDNTWRW